MKSYRRPFHPDCAYVAGRSTVISGVSYGAGEPICTEGIESRRLRQMFEARIIRHADESEVLLSPAAETPPPEKKPSDLTSNSTKRAAKHLGFGKWAIVDENGVELPGGPYTKAEAQKLAA